MGRQSYQGSGAGLAFASGMSQTDAEGLNRLDVDRAQSMADEGGSSGAVVEAEDAPPRYSRWTRTSLLFAATAAASAGLVLICRRRW
jgi:hypothetical protein